LTVRSLPTSPLPHSNSTKTPNKNPQTQYALEHSLRYLPDFLLGGRRIRLAPSHATRTLRLRWLDRTTGQTRTPTLHEITLGTRHFGALESVVPDPPAGLARVTFECYGVYEAFKISLQKGGTNFCLASPPSPPHCSRPRQTPRWNPGLNRSQSRSQGIFFPRRS
jgi:hypothetical protein